jgi:hypothetical protein
MHAYINMELYERYIRSEEVVLVHEGEKGLFVL